jgi:ribose transport system permease protein
MSSATMVQQASRIPGVAAVIVVLAVTFTALNPSFASLGNLANIVSQSTVLLLMALPMTLIIMSEGLDLSMGAVVTFASVILAMTVLATGSTTIGLLAGLGIGLAFGLLNGWLIASLGIPPFVTTLGTMGVAQGLALVVTDGQSVVGMPKELSTIYTGSLLGIPNPLWICTLVYLATHWLLYHTKFGTYVFALGGNREALRLAGVRDRLMLIAVYAFGGLMAGLASLIMTARINSAHPTAAIGLEFDAMAAVALGGTSFERGNGWLFGTVLGVVAVGILRNGLNLIAVPSSAQVACIGVLVILALYLDGLKSRT